MEMYKIPCCAGCMHVGAYLRRIQRATQIKNLAVNGKQKYRLEQVCWLGKHFFFCTNDNNQQPLTCFDLWGNNISKGFQFCIYLFFHFLLNHMCYGLDRIEWRMIFGFHSELAFSHLLYANWIRWMCLGHSVYWTTKIEPWTMCTR